MYTHAVGSIKARAPIIENIVMTASAVAPRLPGPGPFVACSIASFFPTTPWTGESS